ncbi:hypothetical protein HWV62_5201 [Athelia sp. TMB]|nr:hypothetical protein HWV62_5201 [Athelia sp. TMB]
MRLGHAAHFQHSRDSATVYLTAPGDTTKDDGLHMDRVKSLQKALQQEFAECDADTRPYVPHLSIGQAKRAKHAQALKAEVDETMKQFSRAEAGWTLEWVVDRVAVIEREGQHDPFRVVGEVFLDFENDCIST